MKDEDLLETNTGGTSKVYMGKSEARARKTRTLEDEDEEPLDEEEHEETVYEEEHEGTRRSTKWKMFYRSPQCSGILQCFLCSADWRRYLVVLAAVSCSAGAAPSRVRAA